MELIDKELIIKELKRRIDFSDKLADVAAKKNLHNTMEAHELLIAQYGSLLDFLYTLETKEIDLEKEVRKFIKDNGTSLEEPDEFLTTLMLLDDMVMFAKHFFELGLKAQKGE